MGNPLEITLGNLHLDNIFILASGILGTSPSLLARVANNGFGAVVTKSFTRKKRLGYRTPILIATKCGFINAVGLENLGADVIDEFVSEYKQKTRIPIIISIAESSLEDFVYIAKKANDAGADGIELNLSCPHAKKRGIEIGKDPKLVSKIIKRVRKNIDIPLIAKLGLCDNLLKVAKTAEESGADCLTLINTIRAMKIDVWTTRPILSNKFGGLSGPAIHPIAVRCVYEVYEKVSIPIIGCGGVESWEDVIEFLLAGASAIQIGSALVRGLEIINEIKRGIIAYLKRKGFSSVRELIGLAHKRN